MARSNFGQSQGALFVCSSVLLKGVVNRVLKGRSGPEHNTIARGNYASHGMGNGSGRDIWTLTSNPESPISYNTARLERAAG